MLSATKWIKSRMGQTWNKDRRNLGQKTLLKNMGIQGWLEEGELEKDTERKEAPGEVREPGVVETSVSSVR